MSINQQIAERLGWQVVKHQDCCASTCFELTAPNGSCWNHNANADSAWDNVPQYNISRDDAHEIVAWFAARRAPHDDWILARKFADEISPAKHFWDALLATPAQIVAAACKVWGIGGKQ